MAGPAAFPALLDGADGASIPRPHEDPPQSPRRRTQGPLRPSRVPTAALAVALCSSIALAQRWQSLGPAPTTGYGGSAGRISALACSAADPDLYFAGAADGGVWRTRDGGRTWTPLTDDMPTTAIGALAIAPSDDNVVYAGTGEANFANHSRYGLGLLKSDDRGDSWRLLAADAFAGRCFSRIVVHPADPDTLYASITRAGGFPELAAAKGHPLRHGPLGVFRSLDGGETWQRLAGLPDLSATDLALDPADPNVLYAAIGRIFGHQDNGIYKTTDAGETWQKLSLNAGDLGRVSLAVSPDVPDRVAALLTQPASPAGGGARNIGVYTSVDGGANWTPIGSVNQSTYGWYLSTIAFKPGDADRIVAGGLSLVRLDIGGGGRNITPPHVDLHAVAWDAGGRLLVADDGGVHRSNNDGNSWHALNEGLGTIQFYAGISAHPTDTQYLIGGTQDNGTNIRRDDAHEWIHSLGGDGGWTQLDASRPHIVFAEFQGTGNLFRSTDGGASFSAFGGMSGRNCFLPPYLIDPQNPDRLLYATERIWERPPGGAWRAISDDLTAGNGAIRALAIAPGDNALVYAATNDGRFLASEDGGRTFHLRLEDRPGWPRVTREVAVHPHDPRTVYLAGAAFGVEKILRSADAGATFQTLDGDLPDAPVNVLAVDPRGRNGLTPVLYAGADDGLYRSIDDGRTWRRYGQGFPRAPVIDIHFDGPRDRLVVATQGRGAWRVPVAIPGDVNCDGALDQADLAAMLDLVQRPLRAGAREAPCDLFAAADLDGDGGITADDLLILIDLLG